MPCWGYTHLYGLDPGHDMSERTMFVGAPSVREGLRLNITPFIFPFGSPLVSFFLSLVFLISAGTYGARADSLPYIWALFGCYFLFILNFRHSLRQYLRFTQGLPD